MRVVFRCDASRNIGTGHVRRCLTLADELRNSGNEIIFMSDDRLEGNLCSLINSHGYQYIKTNVTDIPELTDLLIVDHYDIDYEWEVMARQHTKKIMVIDDLANRKHDCDLLLDQNLYPDMQKRYEDLVPRNCKLMLGPKYALLREEFRVWRKKTSVRKTLKHLFINFGGSDPHGTTHRVLEKIKHHDFSADIVIGSKDEKIKDFCKDRQDWNLHVNANNMAELMSKSDLGICAGGSTTWERCALGLPSITLAIAVNQKQLSEFLAKRGLCHYIDSCNKVNETLRKYITCPDLLAKQSKLSMDFVDGKGAERCVSIISSKNLN